MLAGLSQLRLLNLANNKLIIVNKDSFKQMKHLVSVFYNIRFIRSFQFVNNVLLYELKFHDNAPFEYYYDTKRKKK